MLNTTKTDIRDLKKSVSRNAAGISFLNDTAKAMQDAFETQFETIKVEMSAMAARSANDIASLHSW
jgi:hypothetical protein